jgi:uncharacterized protein (DUF736 family)
MSYNYGLLNRQNSGAYDFIGQMKAPFFNGKIALERQAVKRAEGSPDYYILGQDKDGNIYPIGKGWQKPFKNGAGNFYSLNFDLPALPEPVNCAAFPDDSDPSLLAIVWNRPRQDGQGASKGFGAAPEGEAAALEDEIPFN